jgi:hypothetical protein
MRFLSDENFPGDAVIILFSLHDRPWLTIAKHEIGAFGGGSGFVFGL